MPLKTHIAQAAKSNTVRTNAVYVPAIVGILSACGITIPVPVILGAYAVINYIIRRWWTKKPLDEK